ncbi:large ribosomal subunit protein mL48 [Ambystoma mexicanum]|uniref:large ribosomal subunit protein mL48 n=1 Tax=Ambystoma mexicanum TaxID=8296 RepID=UPI0037E840C4
MNPARAAVLCLRSEIVLGQAAALSRLTTQKRLPLSSAGGDLLGGRRLYRSMPTHGIGRYKHLLIEETPKKKKEKIQMKEISAGTDWEFGALNVQVSGYDMTLVEHYAQHVHRLCNQLNVKVEESYGLPTKTEQVMMLQEQGTKMYLDAVLTTHERVVQIKGLSSTMAPVFLEILRKNQPEGVKLLIKEHTEADFHKRFKARPELEGLMAQVS